MIYQLTDCWCLDPEKPFDVIYNEKSDRLEPFIDVYQSIETDDGSVLLSGNYPVNIMYTNRENRISSIDD